MRGDGVARRRIIGHVLGRGAQNLLEAVDIEDAEVAAWSRSARPSSSASARVSRLITAQGRPRRAARNTPDEPSSPLQRRRLGSTLMPRARFVSCSS